MEQIEWDTAKFPINENGTKISMRFALGEAKGEGDGSVEKGTRTTRRTSSLCNIAMRSNFKFN